MGKVYKCDKCEKYFDSLPWGPLQGKYFLANIFGPDWYPEEIEKITFIKKQNGAPTKTG